MFELIEALLRVLWWVLSLSLQLAWGMVQAAWVILTGAAALTRAAAIWIRRQGVRLWQAYQLRRRLGPVVATTSTGTPIHVVRGRPGT